ncbi:FAD-dependent oxidoreductase [Microbispora rosea]|uniref:FAD-dependent oxidoreductase n=1 Tax=Microbispora rosea TaxID=58117 RepID=UPI00378D25B2
MTGVRTALVIGGGIAGPVTALALRRAGIEATVHEAYETPADGLGGWLQVAPNGLEALRILGAADSVEASGRPIRRTIIADGRGRKFGAYTGVPGLPPGRALRRSELYRLLHDHAAAQGVRVEHGRRLDGVEETDDGVTARFADGSTATADVLVGADGIRSTVRTLVDPEAPGPAYAGLIAFAGRADLTVPGPPDTMHYVFGRRAFLGHWTGPDGRTVWFGNLPRPEPMTAAQAREVPAAEWLEVLREAYADDVPGGDLLRHTEAGELSAVGALEILPAVPRWHRGRMVLAGDAAHAPSPSSGQGVALAVESAVQLARCLRDLPDVPAAFSAYERLRRDRVEKIAASAARTNSRKASGRLARMLMSVTAPIAMRTFATPRRMFGWMHGYRIDWDETVTP